MYQQPYENLLSGFQTPVVTKDIIVATNEELAAGQVFALNEQGQATATIATADKVYGIMADAIATSGEPRPSVYYAAGEFNKYKVLLPKEAVFVEYEQALRKLGIYLDSAVKNEEDYNA